MKILLLDLETSPNVVYTWGLWDQNVGLSQIVKPTEVLCFAAQWYGEKGIAFYSQHHDGRTEMVEAAHALLDEADVVMHWNGKRFDIPHLNREFVEAGLQPPSPYVEVDLLLTARKKFKFVSNKLEHVSRQLGLEGKVKHEGFELWTKCLAGDEAAWKRMKKYNKQDVQLLGELYEILRPWIPSHPSVRLYDGTEGCPRCSSTSVQKRGLARTKTGEFQQFHCTDCGAWFRATKRDRGVKVTDVA